MTKRRNECFQIGSASTPEEVLSKHFRAEEQTMPSTDTRAGTKVEPHVRCEGSRFHVLWWDGRGRHCSEPMCEINHPKPEKPDEH